MTERHKKYPLRAGSKKKRHQMDPWGTPRFILRKGECALLKGVNCYSEVKTIALDPEVNVTLTQ